MDNVQELYRICSSSQATEKALKLVNKELAEFIQSNITQNERPIFFDAIESINKTKEEYFFKAGFSTAVTLLIEKR